MIRILPLLICIFLLGVIGCFEITPDIGTTSAFIKTNELTPSDLDGHPPRDVQLFEDTLYVLTRDTAGPCSVEIYTYSTMTHVGSIKAWTDSDGKSDSLNKCNTLFVNKNLVFVGSHGSKIDVFDRLTSDYITTIGTGKWYGDDDYRIVHSFAITANETHLFVKDKMRVRTYLLSDLTFENKNHVLRESQSQTFSESASRHGLAIYNDYLFVTDNNNKVIYKFNLTDFNPTKLDVMPIDSIELSTNPHGIAVYKDLLYVVDQKGAMGVWNPDTHENLFQYDWIDGHTLDHPITIHFYDDTFFMLEQKTETIIAGVVKYTDFEIYKE